MAFPHGIEPVFVPVYPTPLYELTAGLPIGWWLWWRLGKPHATGAILGQYLMLTGMARFLVEFIRRNPKVLWGLSNAQLASAGAVLAGIALTWWAATRPALARQKAPAPVESRPDCMLGPYRHRTIEHQFKLLNLKDEVVILSEVWRIRCAKRSRKPALRVCDFFDFRRIFGP